MPPEPDLKPIWERIDQHNQALQSHEVAIKLNERVLEKHDEEFRKMNRALSAQHEQILSKIDNLGTSLGAEVKELREDYQRRQGAETAATAHQHRSTVQFRIIIGVIGAVGTIIGTAYLFTG